MASSLMDAGRLETLLSCRISLSVHVLRSRPARLLLGVVGLLDSEDEFFGLVFDQVLLLIDALEDSRDMPGGVVGESSVADDEVGAVVGGGGAAAPSAAGSAAAFSSGSGLFGVSFVAISCKVWLCSSWGLNKSSSTWLLASSGGSAISSTGLDVIAASLVTAFKPFP